jgi:PAS domain S-box-containing protein
MAAILIVEDRPVDRKYLATLLKSVGHSVTGAADGLEGLRLARLAPPDLIISDILMPTVDGYEFVRRVREIETLARTPVIFYTATYHEREARALAQICGVAEILTKPSEPDAILAKVDAVLAAGGHLTTAVRDPAQLTTAVRDAAQFNRDHLRVVSSALESKAEDFEASEQRMAAIVGLTQQIAAERDTGVLLERLCTAARDVTLAQHAAVMMLTHERSAFQRVATRGIADETLRGMDVPAVDGPAFRQAIVDRQPVRLRNPQGHPEAIGLPENDPPTYSCLVVPIASPDLVYGCLCLRNRLGADGFGDRDEEVALTLATHAGIAYDNARLVDDLRHRSVALEQEVADRRRAEARTQLALRAAQMGVWELDLAADRLDWSDSLAAIFGLLPPQAPTTHDEFVALIHPDDRVAAQEALERAVRERTDIASEFRVVWPDNTVHWIAGRARILTDESGRSTRILGVAMDIGERKSLEEQLRQAQKMEAVGQLAGGVAHDFNNLLTVIHGYAELLLGTFEAEDQRWSDLDEIVKAAERATDLTRQLLTFSRRQVLKPTLLDMNRLVRSTSTMLRRLIGEDIELLTTLSPAPAMVHADEGQLEQILMNLAVNARDAMQGGGRLSIETAVVVFDGRYAMGHVDVRPGPYVMLAVTDSGIGMDGPTKERIFEPFFTTKPRGHGTGLGLSTVYGIVKQSGGYIWVYSEPGLGATFKVCLPQIEGVAAERQTATGAKAAPTGSETVLLVEDDEGVRQLSRVLLDRAGYRVLDAADPMQAFELFRQHADRIDLLVTDVIMPGSSGPSLFAWLSEERPALRVLYMSGYTDDAIVQHGGLPADIVYLQKPFTADRLLRKVREALDRRSDH